MGGESLIQVLRFFTFPNAKGAGGRNAAEFRSCYFLRLIISIEGVRGGANSGVAIFFICNYKYKILLRGCVNQICNLFVCKY